MLDFGTSAVLSELFTQFEDLLHNDHKRQMTAFGSSKSGNLDVGAGHR